MTPEDPALAIAQEIAHLLAVENASRAKRERLENAIRTALGTAEIVPEVESAPTSRKSARPVHTPAHAPTTARAPAPGPVPAPVTAPVPMPSPIPVPALDQRVADGDTMYAKLRTALSEHSLTSKQLAKATKIPLETIENALKELRRSQQVYRFEEDETYCWCLGVTDSKTREAFIARLMRERQVTREMIMHAFGCTPKNPKLKFDVQNSIEQVRRTFPVWGTKDAREHWIFWLLPNGDGSYQKPPPSQDGSLPPRTRPPKDKAKKK